MGYRHYFYQADKKHCEAVKHLTPALFDAYCSMHFPQSESFMETLGQKEIFEFGKLYFDDAAERIYAKTTPLFTNAEMQDCFSDYNIAIAGKEAVKEAIEIYKEKIINYYKDVLEDEAIVRQGLFGVEIKRDDIKSVDKLCSHIKSMLQWWQHGVINLNEDNPRLADSWLYEHTIFDLVRIYKTTDWDKHCILFYGW